jgi:DNA (cytosine-5)-methyltransferase 1
LPTRSDPANEDLPNRKKKPTRDPRAQLPPTPLKPPVTLWEAIGDLPPLAEDQGEYEAPYNLVRREAHIRRYGSHFLKRVLEVPRAKVLFGHVARPHSERDLRDFARLREGEHSAEALARGQRMEFPYGRDHFKDRYTRQHRNRLCSTILAHLSKDGLMFIHPTQERSLTSREAARVQTFPDWFIFPESRTVTFRLIGNAVPPLVGEAIGNAVRRYISHANRSLRRGRQRTAVLTARGLLPRNEKQAVARLTPLMQAAHKKKELQTISNKDFRAGWFSLGFIHNRLHPDAAFDNGANKTYQSNGIHLRVDHPRGLINPVFERSGWPVVLIPIAKEAFRRLRQGDLNVAEYYCSKARVAGARLMNRVNGRNGTRARQ